MIESENYQAMIASDFEAFDRLPVELRRMLTISPVPACSRSVFVKFEQFRCDFGLGEARKRTAVWLRRKVRDQMNED